jgi:L-alanine-DL-glutamate epimerase-like enolase superfamily enzyme
MSIIEGFELHKLTLPLGRTVGDNNCSYDLINVVAIALKSNHGHVAWGYSEFAWQGTFKHDAWYVHNLPNAAQLEIEFLKSWWPLIRNKSAFDLEMERVDYASGFPNIDAAVRLALWDLKAQEKNIPLYRLLNPDTQKQEAFSYGSILDFPLSDKEALDLTEKFMLNGFNTIKVKIGAEDVERDIRRMKLIHAYTGSDVKLTADANEAWDWETALDRIETYLSHGIELEYLEDPLRRDDIEGHAELTKRSPLPIIGHDYVNEFEDLKRLVEMGGLNGIRTGKDIDYAIQCINLGKTAGIPVYLGNSMFEINAHLALAFEGVDRTEFSSLAWNNIIVQPINFKNGYIQAPGTVGHGLFPTREKLTEFSSEDGRVNTLK